MKELSQLFENNRHWAERKKRSDPEFFSRLAKAQTPKYLWVGCSDSRIPASEVLGLEPGDLFVHRNVGNLFIHTDFNCLSVLQYAVDVLSVEHVIVCGHYGCAGIAAAMKNSQFGLVDNWLCNIRDIYSKERRKLDNISDDELRYHRLVELNVLYQVRHVCCTTIVQNAWAMQKRLSIHGWVYDLSTGRLKDLNCCVSSLSQVEQAYRTLELE